jgi:hypothetical protein
VNILWVCRRVTNDGGGDAVFDRKLVEGLRALHRVDLFDIGKNPLRARLERVVLARIPPDRAGFGGPDDVARLYARLAGGEYDAVVISHEHLDYLVDELGPLARGRGLPIFVVHHNVTSSLMRGVLPAPFGLVVERAYRAYEKRVLGRKQITKPFVVSLHDQKLMKQISGREDIGVIMPGAPRSLPLAPDAVVVPELVMLGSYDWFPKRWSLNEFIDEWQACRPPPAAIYADDGVPASAREALDLRPVSTIDLTRSIRFGLLTDRFQAGHKLKTAAYLMNNCVVLTFAEVIEDFRFSPHADLFIRRIHHVREIAPLMRELGAITPAALRARLVEFKASIADRLSWQRQTSVLADALGALASEQVSARSAQANT